MTTRVVFDCMIFLQGAAMVSDQQPVACDSPRLVKLNCASVLKCWTRSAFSTLSRSCKAFRRETETPSNSDNEAACELADIDTKLSSNSSLPPSRRSYC